MWSKCRISLGCNWWQDTLAVKPDLCFQAKIIVYVSYATSVALLFYSNVSLLFAQKNWQRQSIVYDQEHNEFCAKLTGVNVELKLAIFYGLGFRSKLSSNADYLDDKNNLETTEIYWS